MIFDILNIIYTNKYSYSLLMFLIIYSYMRIYLKRSSITPTASSRAFLQYLHEYYITSFTYTIFMVLLYFCSYFGVFLIIRYNLLGTTMELPFISINTNYPMLLPLIVVLFTYLLNIILYLKILDELCYIHIIRLHLYLCKYERYVSIKDYFRDNTEIISEFFTYGSRFIRKYLKKMRKITRILEKSNRAVLLFIYRNVFPKLEILETICDLFSIHTSRFLNCGRHMIVFFALFYDITHGKLYYCYFAFFIFVILNYLKKLRTFFAVKDPIESLITDHFYEDPSSYNYVVLYSLNKEVVIDYNNLSLVTRDLLQLQIKLELIPYIQSNFIIYYLRDHERVANYEVLLNEAKRLNIMFALLVIASYFMGYLDKYTLKIMSVQLNILIPLFLFGVILSIIHHKIRYFNDKDYSAENKKFKIIFYIIVFIVAVFLGYIILKNKLILNPNETICDLDGIISVSEVFSIDEKKDYLERYLKYMGKVLESDQALVNYLIKEANITIIITEDLLMQNIRDIIQEIISSYQSSIQAKENPVVNLYDYIKILWKKIHLFFTKK